jgi:hypothetical protein
LEALPKRGRKRRRRRWRGTRRGRRHGRVVPFQECKPGKMGWPNRRRSSRRDRSQLTIAVDDRHCWRTGYPAPPGMPHRVQAGRLEAQSETEETAETKTGPRDRVSSHWSFLVPGRDVTASARSPFREADARPGRFGR